MNTKIYNILNDMSIILNAQQMKKLQEVLINRLQNDKSDEIEKNHFK